MGDTLCIAWHSTYRSTTCIFGQCPESWCSHWKGTPQDCIDHIRLRHHAGLSVKTASLGKWFPPWTVALKPNASGIATDVVLFSQHGARLVHHYRVYGEYVSHSSLHGTFMAKLSGVHEPGLNTGLYLRPGRWPNVVGNCVMSPVHRRVIRHRRPKSCTGYVA